MSSRNMVMIIAGVIVLFTIVSLRTYFKTPAPVVPTETAAPRALVAKRPLVPGAFVQVAMDLDWQPVDEKITTEGLLLDNAIRAEDFAGAVVRRSINAGEHILAADLMKSGEGGFLSAVLAPGMRAVSISVTLTSGNAGFISPGDKVDLLITHRIKPGGKESSSDDQVITETFARGVRVLAVDQQLNNPDNKAILAKTVTVEVTPRQAEQVSVAEELGKISMALVSNGSKTDEVAATQETSAPKVVTLSNEAAPEKASTEYTRDGDVSSMLGKKEDSFSRVRVIRGDAVEILEFYQDKR